MAGRYIPPSDSKAHNAQNQQEAKQRTLGELTKEQEDEVFIVKLRSDKKYDDIPFTTEVLEHGKEEDDSAFQQFEFPLGYKNLRKLMLWFRTKSCKDQDAVLEFPLKLKKEQRKLVHEIAQSFGLGTSSQGFGENRFISVYSVEKATLGVGKVYLTPEEKKKAEEIWQLVKQEDDEKFKMFSHNEIEEMILVNKLDPLLQGLWEKKESLLLEDFKAKCKVSE